MTAADWLLGPGEVPPPPVSAKRAYSEGQRGQKRSAFLALCVYRPRFPSESGGGLPASRSCPGTAAAACRQSPLLPTAAFFCWTARGQPWLKGSAVLALHGSLPRPPSESGDRPPAGRTRPRRSSPACSPGHAFRRTCGSDLLAATPSGLRRRNLPWTCGSGGGVSAPVTGSIGPVGPSAPLALPPQRALPVIFLIRGAAGHPLAPHPLGHIPFEPHLGN